MKPSTMAVAVSLIIPLLLVGLFAVYYFDSSSLEANQDQTISGLEATISSFQSHPLISTILSSTTITTTAVSSTQTVTQLPGVPWTQAVFLSLADSCAKGPCFSSDITKAVVFTCLASAATPQGCTEQVNGSKPSSASYVVTIMFPYANQPNEPSWANCVYTTPPSTGSPNAAYCVQLGLSGFILAEQAPSAP